MKYDNYEQFREDMMRGYVLAFKKYVLEVPGGVVKVEEIPHKKVAVVNGGGSGHYPAFYGFIGQGGMDGTAVGSIFSSPSAEDVYNVAKEVENGCGVFIIGGNYAGDRINFDLARDRLRSEGIDARTFYITDDIASASIHEMEKRRGNIGTFTIFKIAGAASESGYIFDNLVEVVARANRNTKTISVGLQGCRLPWEKTPLFKVPEGKMEIGQGIHGEPGIFETDLATASEIASLLVEKILEEKPQNSGNRIAVILDGLGATKYEELFVIWKTIAEKFESQGFELVEPLVGEYVTSLDMEGIALSVTFLDDELEKLWIAPMDTPALKREKEIVHAEKRRRIGVEDKKYCYKDISSERCTEAGYVVGAFEEIQRVLRTNETYLAQIDSVAGDGDHGRGMVKGSYYALKAAEEVYQEGADAGTCIIAAGEAWASKAGGTSGVLWGNALITIGNMILNHSRDDDVRYVGEAVSKSIDKIQELGGAKIGDKTILDSLIPFANVLIVAIKQEKNLLQAWTEAAEVAEEKAYETKNLLPKVGRARPQAERSFGTPDAGAVSFAICMKAIAQYMRKIEEKYNNDNAF